jgi:2-polyprenyl-3-methyl-5-hydroxy-6-metoxy-1,4-benzoquinol methylase
VTETPEHPESAAGGAPAFGSEWWERHYRDKGAGAGAPSPYLVAEAAGLSVGRALDAGCGNGADARWLARQGWEVTAVDVSPTAVAAAQSASAEETADVARRLSWVVADLNEWAPPERYDLVVSQYVHPGVPFADFVSALARAVRPGGTLLVVGHDHADAHSAAHAPEDASIELASVTEALIAESWVIEIAENRTRAAVHDSTEIAIRDVVVKARRDSRGTAGGRRSP